MSMRNYGASAIIVNDNFVFSVAREEYRDLIDFIIEISDDEDTTLNDFSLSLAYDDKKELKEVLQDNYDEFMEKLTKLEQKFKDATGLTLLHLHIDNDQDDSDLDFGHHFALDFSEVYQVSDKAQAIREHWCYEQWSVFG